MANTQIKSGDVVYLKSGGPAMTVESIRQEYNTANCSWFDGSKLCEHSIQLDALTTQKPTPDVPPTPIMRG